MLYHFKPWTWKGDKRQEINKSSTLPNQSVVMLTFACQLSTERAGSQLAEKWSRGNCSVQSALEIMNCTDTFWFFSSVRLCCSAVTSCCQVSVSIITNALCDEIIRYVKTGLSNHKSLVFFSDTGPKFSVCVHLTLYWKVSHVVFFGSALTVKFRPEQNTTSEIRIWQN